MSDFFGLYEAKVKQKDEAAESIVLLVPQVFGTSEVPCIHWTGSPEAGDMGFVAFIGGDPTWPVWISK